MCTIIYTVTMCVIYSGSMFYFGFFFQTAEISTRRKLPGPPLRKRKLSRGGRRTKPKLRTMGYHGFWHEKWWGYRLFHGFLWILIDFDRIYGIYWLFWWNFTSFINQTYLGHPQTIHWHLNHTWYGKFIELHREFSCEPSLTTIIKVDMFILKFCYIDQ